MDWLELKIDTSHAGLDAVTDMLEQQGVTGVMIDDEADFQSFLENNRQYWDYVDDDLLAQKKQAREKETAPRIPELDAYLLAEFAHAEQVLEALPNPAAPDLGRLNVVFQTMLAETSDDFQNFPNSDE